MSLTASQREKLREAIRLAKGRGGCRYEKGGAPCCVVGQLAVLEGLSVRTLQKWDRIHFEEEGGSDVGMLAQDGLLPKRLAAYGSALLYALQDQWDRGDDKSAHVVRARMRQIVEHA